MSAFTRPPPGKRPPRHVRVLAALREPAVVRMALAGVVAGLIGGLAAFWTASSRGLDNLELGELIASAWAVIALAMVLGAIVLLLWADDLRVGVLLATLFAGSWVGSAAAFYVVPGNTTDGSLAVSIGAAPGAAPGVSSQRLAMCTWDRVTGTVTTIDQRRLMTAVPHVHIIGRVELATTDAPATLTIDAPATLTIAVLAPVSFEPVARFHGTAQPILGDATGRAGSLIVVNPSYEELPAAGEDPDLMLFIRQVLHEINAARQATMTWECPQLP